jgi:hypothetical protein
MKRQLLRFAVFLLVLCTSHWLMQWLHPMGANAFFWNLAFGAGIAWLVMRYSKPHFGDNVGKHPLATSTPVTNDSPQRFRDFAAASSRSQSRV